MRRQFSGSDRIFYFAYGSNMNSTVFQGRRRMRPTKIERAILKNYRLVFNQPGIPWIEPSFANIERAEGEFIEGVLYEITEDEMHLLDLSEGGGAYDIVTSQAEGEVSGPVIAHTFMTNDVASGLHPSQRYMNILVAGANEHALSAEWIAKLQEAPYRDHPVSRRLSPLIMAFIRICIRLQLPHPFRWWKRYQVYKTRRSLGSPSGVNS
jgi:hypothetical protein